MSYKPTNWQNGITPLNAQNMNHIEEGIVGNDTEISKLKVKVNNQSTSINDLSLKLPKMIILKETD